MHVHAIIKTCHHLHDGLYIVSFKSPLCRQDGWSNAVMQDWPLGLYTLLVESYSFVKYCVVFISYHFSGL